MVDFTATWCGPCRMIGPVFEELSGQYPQLIFVKVDVDACDVSGLAFACQERPALACSCVSALL